MNLGTNRLVGLRRPLSQVLRSTIRYYATQESIGKMVKKKPVVVFMKGVPDNPRCGFSNAVVQILRMHGVNYDSYDVLEDESLREEIKTFSNWPTVPQVFINGEFVGGCDIVIQMHQSGELIDEFKKVGIRSALIDTALAEEKSDGNKKE